MNYYTCVSMRHLVPRDIQPSEKLKKNILNKFDNILELGI